MKALVVTPASVKAVEEVCVTCGSNHNFNLCPLTRGGNDFPVFQDNIQQFQQTAAVGNFLQRNQPSNLASQMKPPELELEALTPTRMTLELANRSISHPMGIAEDVVVRVDGFTFLADFVVVNFEPDPRVPIILGRPFLRTAKALIDFFFLNTPLSEKEEVFCSEVDNDEIDDFHKSIEVSSNLEEGYFDSEGDIAFLDNLLSDDDSHNLDSQSTVLPLSSYLVEDSDPTQDEIDILLVPDKFTFRLVLKNADSEDELDEVNESPNLDHQDDPSIPRPPPEPPDIEKCFEPKAGILIIKEFKGVSKSHDFMTSILPTLVSDLPFISSIYLLFLRTTVFRDRVELRLWYGYVKNHKKSVKKRTRERMSDQEAKEIKAEAREIMPQPSTVNCSFHSQLPKPTPLFYKFKG
ncbi:reverse transcriptase domain-containing protein [Tanacetum coccineum]